jgi:signal transduction histidine kinase
MKSFPIRFFAYSLTVTAAVAAMVLILYRQDLNKQRLLAESEGRYGVNLHAAVLDNEFSAVKSDLLFMAGQEELRRYLAQPAAPGAREAIAGEYLLFAGRKALYDQVRFIDSEGNERVRINYNAGRPEVVAERDLQHKSDRYYFREALALGRGQVYASPFDLNVERGTVERPIKPTIRFATPVFDARGRKRGVVVLNYLGDVLLRKLDESAPRPPGTLLLLNGDGAWLRGLRREDEWAFMFGHDRTFGMDFPEAWRELSRAPKGRFVLKDGLFAFKNVSPAGADAASGGGASLLRVVFFLPHAGLYAASRHLLKVLLIICGFVEVILLVLVWLLCRAQALRESHQRQLEASESRLRVLSLGLIEAQERERKIISRDLHDDLGQILTAACLELERALSGDRRKVRPEVLEGALRNTQAALTRMHEISARLRPRVLDDLGLKEAVRTLLDDCERKTGIEVRRELEFENRDVSLVVSEHLYRILQEALTNVVAHAKTGKSLVRFHRGNGKIELMVKDWGVGFVPGSQQMDSLGVLSMRERCELLGGEFSLSSAPGRGTEVRAVVPAREPGAA